jgi:hypothetical protein
MCTQAENIPLNSAEQWVLVSSYTAISTFYFQHDHYLRCSIAVRPLLILLFYFTSAEHENAFFGDGGNSLSAIFRAFE